MIYTADQVARILSKQLIVAKVAILGYRASDSKYGEYDDVIAVFTPEGYNEFKGNTLPSVNKPDVAVLQPGNYTYRIGLHGISHFNLEDSGDKALYDQLLATKKDLPPIAGRILPYWACRQDGPVLIKRIGATAASWDGWPVSPVYIDVHRGGFNLTSSLGCQTLYPDHWQQFFWQILVPMLAKYGQATFTYSLIQQ